MRICPVAIFCLTLASFLPAAELQAAEITIKEMSDIDFGQVPPTAGEQSAAATFCVALDERSRYQVIALGSGAGGQFSLQNTTDARLGKLDYQVYVNDRGGRRGSALRPSVPLTGLRGKRAQKGGRCPRPPARLTVEISDLKLRAARPGRYRGTLSLTVVPE